MGRTVGLDLGERRIGVAVSDDAGILATAYEVIERSGDDRAWRSRVADVVREVSAERVVIGLPLSLSGRMGPAARAAAEAAAALATVVAVPVETFDERLTTVAADRAMAPRAKPGAARGRSRRRVVDQVAAAVMLQSWLDTHRSGA